MTIHLFVYGHLADAVFLKYLLSDGTVAELDPILKTAKVVGWQSELYRDYAVLNPRVNGQMRDIADGFVVDLDEAQQQHLLRNEAPPLNLKLVPCEIEIPQGQCFQTAIVHKVAEYMFVWAGDVDDARLTVGQFDMLNWETVVKNERVGMEGQEFNAWSVDRQCASTGVQGELPLGMIESFGRI